MSNSESDTIQTFDGPDPDGMGQCCYAVHQSQIQFLNSSGKQVKLFQLFGIVKDCLPMAQPIFQGAKRPLNSGDNQNGDREKLFLVLNPTFDFDWSTTGEEAPKIERTTAPEDSVFVVMVTPNNDNNYLSVDFWIENWCWVDESGNKSGYPLNHQDRYDKEKTRPISRRA